VTATQKRFFHWFLEFPEIIERGGFDCILGNPPYLGGQDLSGTYGHPFCGYVKWEFAPAGLSDLVVYFVRRIYSLLRTDGFTSFITTNSIKDGDIRKDGLDRILGEDGEINFAVRGVKWPGRANLVVALLSIHKGLWGCRSRTLDGKSVPFISSRFEDYPDEGEPFVLQGNHRRLFVGVIYMGEGFLLSENEAQKIIREDSQHEEVIQEVINGKELNNRPDQASQRRIINFADWPLERAERFHLAFNRILTLVKPERDKLTRAVRRERWWQYAERAKGLYDSIRHLRRCFVIAQTGKHHAFSAVPTNRVFLQTCYVFASDRWWEFAVLQSQIHHAWVLKYSGALKNDPRYLPSQCFLTFPFPQFLVEYEMASQDLAIIGERYHEHRRDLMRQLWLGLTDIYNLFHTHDLTPEMVAKVSKKSNEEADAGYRGLLKLRRLHQDLDQAVRDAYGWQDLNLDHDFYEVETLPENDRVRYTISPTARKEVLRRLLALNHERAKAEQAATIASKNSLSRRTKKKAEGASEDLFSGEENLRPPN